MPVCKLYDLYDTKNDFKCIIRYAKRSDIARLLKRDIPTGISSYVEDGNRLFGRYRVLLSEYDFAEKWNEAVEPLRHVR